MKLKKKNQTNKIKIYFCFIFGCDWGMYTLFTNQKKKSKRSKNKLIFNKEKQKKKLSFLQHIFITKKNTFFFFLSFFGIYLQEGAKINQFGTFFLFFTFNRNPYFSDFSHQLIKAFFNVDTRKSRSLKERNTKGFCQILSFRF